jgi:heme/copper-type cytochrome/quinol oxidase subunit 2
MFEIWVVLVILVALLLFLREREENLPQEQQLEEKVAGLSFGDLLLVVAGLFIVAFILFVMGEA